MRFFLSLLMSLYAAGAWGQEFVCAFGLAPEGASDASSRNLAPEGASGASSHNVAHYRSGTVKMLILFGKLNGDADPGSLTRLWNRNEDTSPRWSAADLLNSEFAGSLAHYFKEMSYGALTLSPGTTGIPMKFYQSNNSTTSSYHIPQVEADCTVSKWSTGTTGTSGMQQIVREILENADDELNFSRLETSGDHAGFSAYDGDKDGKIDIIGVVTPRTACPYSGTVLPNFQYPDPVNPGKMITVDRVVTTDWRGSFPYIVGVLAHEYGHAMGLPELFDRDHISSNPTIKADTAGHSAGIGAWGTMGKSPSWDHEGAQSGPDGNPDRVVDGPNPLSVWSRMQVGWITDDTSAPLANQRLGVVNSDETVEINDINSANGKVFKIPMHGSTTEYFLVANRQNRHSESPSIGSFYDTYAPASGLLIWHVDELAESD